MYLVIFDCLEINNLRKYLKDRGMADVTHVCCLSGEFTISIGADFRDGRTSSLLTCGSVYNFHNYEGILHFRAKNNVIAEFYKTPHKP